MSDEKTNFEEEVKETVNDMAKGANDVLNQDNKKVLAGVLGILLGYLGIHKFILGYNKEGIILLAVSVLTCGIGAMATSLVGLIEGIIYLTKSDEEFIQTYQVGKKPWF